MCLGESFPIPVPTTGAAPSCTVFDESSGTMPGSLEAAELKVDRVNEVHRLPHREAKRAKPRHH
jgi:hypothetical protein